MKRYTLKYKKEVVRLFLKRAPGVTSVRFAEICGVSDTMVRVWVEKYKGRDVRG